MEIVTQTHFVVYKITNKINSKTYIGCHKTKKLDDKYMGSGKIIKRAMLKNGVENFEKKILFDFNNSKEMFAKEVELIAALKPEYNIHEGGRGGWEYVNSSGLSIPIQTLNKEYQYAQKSNIDRRNARVESYGLQPSTCNSCDKALGYKSKSNSFCSKSCSAIYNNRKRIVSGWKMSQSSKEKISKSLHAYNNSTERNCKKCEARIVNSSIRIYCKFCQPSARVPIEMFEDLHKIKKDIKHTSSRTIALKYGVTHSTILKYSKKYVSIA